ncbi:hypothetical protein GCM10008955_41430 [Deinococcus malanensis]|uniref:Aminoglycoside phosphotransferase domain-containing protein n=1 Tax=Deinococcus malanensis TaxID=1706855 RepID=A0ABQ2F5K3_9DEIO|nr:hypothetical protein GCM10008955_41430 [Deinococcus malanensis]
MVLVCEAAQGRSPELPWRGDNLDHVMVALTKLWLALTPSPLRPPTVGLAGDTVARSLNGWKRLSDPETAGELVAPLDAWSARHLGALVTLEAHAPKAVEGDTLLHFDIRADNLLMDSGGPGPGVWFVDWPHACVGASWFEVACFAPSVAMQGGPQPEGLMARRPNELQPSPADLLAGVA